MSISTTDATCTIDDPGFERKISIAKQGSKSTVVWNPWVAKAARMPDYGDDEYPEMVCIETTNAENDAQSVKTGPITYFDHYYWLKVDNEESASIAQGNVKS